jgi:hypothetical protein
MFYFCINPPIIPPLAVAAFSITQVSSQSLPTVQAGGTSFVVAHLENMMSSDTAPNTVRFTWCICVDSRHCKSCYLFYKIAHAIKVTVNSSLFYFLLYIIQKYSLISKQWLQVLKNTFNLEDYFYI